MAPRVAVLVRPVEGGHQAVCQTRDCAQGVDGGKWKSEVHPVKAGAEDDARQHRQWHRAQRPIPADLPKWARLTDLGEGRWRLDLDGTANGIRIAGHATGSSPEALRKLVAAIEHAVETQVGSRS